MTIGALVLAAGASRRFGSDKRRAVLADGETLLHKTLFSIQEAGLPILVCLGAGDERAAEILEQHHFASCACDRADRGIGATLAQGVQQELVGNWDGLLVCLADMPYIESTTLRLLADQLSVDTICAPVYAGRRGHPVGFGRAFFAALAGLDGDEGARKILRDNPAALSLVAVSDAGVLQDIDVPEDLTVIS